MKRVTVFNRFNMTEPRGTMMTGICRTTIFLALLVSCACCSRYIEKAIESPGIEGGVVTIRFRSASARTVQVAGDWNNWGSGDAEVGEVLVGLMERMDKSDTWVLSVELGPGRYRYRLLINETQWVLDPNNTRVVEDGRGGKANLIILP